MTNTIQPATDEEIEVERDGLRFVALIARLIARIDAERAARERAEATLAKHTQPALASNLGGYHAVRDAIAAAIGHEPTWGWSLVIAVRDLAARAEKAEEDLAALREACAGSDVDALRALAERTRNKGWLRKERDEAIAAREKAEAERDAALISSGDSILKAAEESSGWRARVAQAEAERDALRREMELVREADARSNAAMDAIEAEAQAAEARALAARSTKKEG